MKKITSVTVTYADGSTQTIDGPGHLRVVNSQQVVEFWPPNEPERDKPKERVEQVRYVTIGMHPQEPLTE